MSDIHALSGAYAIDALDDVERARFARHLGDCADCRDEVDSLRETAALLPETTTIEAPGSLRVSVLDAIDEVRPLPPIVSAAPVLPSRHRRGAALVAAAAAFIAIGGVGATVWHPWSDDSSQVTPPSAAQQVFNADDAEIWSQRLADGGTVTVARSASLNLAAVRVHGMAPAGEGRQYQLWLQHDNAMVSAGLMPEGSAGTLLLEGEPASADGFGITREPTGGSAKPTRPPVALIEFDRA